MESIGAFNGVTATSLVLLEQDKIDKLYSLTNKHADEYSAVSLLEELHYLKAYVSEENIARIEEKVKEKKDGEVSGLSLLLKGVGDYIFSNISGGTTETLNAEDDMFGGEDDMFSGGEDDLFSGGEDDLFSGGGEDDLFSGDDMFSGVADSQPVLSLTDLSAEQLMQNGFESFSITSENVETFTQELQEYAKAKSFFDVRFRKFADVPLVQAYKDNSEMFSAKYFADKPLFNYAVEDNHLSLYNLTSNQMKYVYELSNQTLDTSKFSTSSMPDTPAARIFNHIKNSAQKIDECISKFEAKASTLDGASYILLRTPANRLQYAFNNYHVSARMISITKAINDEGSYKEKTLDLMLSQAYKVLEYIASLEDVQDSQKLMEDGEVLMGIITSLRVKGAMPPASVRAKQTEELKNFAKLVNSKGLVQVVKGGEVSPEEKMAIAMLYALYSMSKEFKLSKLADILGEKLDFDQFIEMNNELVDKYELIPLTVSFYFESAVLQNFEHKAAVDAGAYKNIIPNINLLIRHLESQKFVLSNSDLVCFEIG